MARRGAKVISMARTQSDLVSLQADIGCTTIKVDLTDNVLPALR
jgi:short-subunit dehydrogenase